MAANVEKSPLIRFVDELDFKQIRVSVKSSSREEDELEGENNSDQDQTSSSCSESGEISKSGEGHERKESRGLQHL